MSKSKRLVKNTLIIGLGSLFSKCVNFLMLPFYTNLLSTNEYGTIDVLTTISVLVCVIMTLQFDQGLFRYLVESRSDFAKQREYISTSIFTILLCCMLFTFFSFIFFHFLYYRYKFEVVLLSVLGTVYGVICQIPRGLGNNTKYTIANTLYGICTVIFNVIFIAGYHLGINGMIYSMVIASIVCLIYLYISNNLNQYFKLSAIKMDALYELLSYSIPLIPYTLCWWTIDVSDRLFISYFLGETKNGIYAVAMKFPSILTMITNVFHISWVESAATNINSNNRNSFFNAVINKTIILFSSFNLVVISIVPLVFNIIIGTAYMESYYYIPILMCAALFHAIANVFGALYFALKKTKQIATTVFMAALANVLIDIIFIRFLGLFAASFASLVACVIIACIRYAQMSKNLHIILEYKPMLLVLIAYLFMCLIYYSGHVLLNISSFCFCAIFFFIINKDTLVRLYGMFIPSHKGKM